MLMWYKTQTQTHKCNVENWIFNLLGTRLSGWAEFKSNSFSFLNWSSLLGNAGPTLYRIRRVVFATWAKHKYLNYPYLLLLILMSYSSLLSRYYYYHWLCSIYYLLCVIYYLYIIYYLLFLISYLLLLLINFLIFNCYYL